MLVFAATGAVIVLMLTAAVVIATIMVVVVMVVVTVLMVVLVLVMVPVVMPVMLVMVLMTTAAVVTATIMVVMRLTLRGMRLATSMALLHNAMNRGRGIPLQHAHAHARLLFAHLCHDYSPSTDTASAACSRPTRSNVATCSSANE